MPASREWFQSLEEFFIHGDSNVGGIPDVITARPGALKVMDRPVAFFDLDLVVSGLLELPIHVGGKDEIPSLLLLAYVE